MIFHIDADAFFASCEQAIHPELVGRPVITGAERGIVSAASYEAKNRGVSRGVALHEVRHIIPDAVILPSDYETYSLFSRRMFSILRRYAPGVEEYSIDEAFLNMAGLEKVRGMSFEELAYEMQSIIFSELGIGVSIGIGSSKVLAKLGSRQNKPRGVCYIASHNVDEILAGVGVEKVWGIGSATTRKCRAMGICSALQFKMLPRRLIDSSFYKPFREIWYELNGISVLPVGSGAVPVRQSIQKVKTFSPSTSDGRLLYSRLVHNIENACIKLRRKGLLAREIGVYLRSHDFCSRRGFSVISRPTSCPVELISYSRRLFDKLFDPEVTYRATGFYVIRFQQEGRCQPSLFDSFNPTSTGIRVGRAIDEANAYFGKHSVRMGSYLYVDKNARATGSSGMRPAPSVRSQMRLPGETARSHIALPFFHVKV